MLTDLARLTESPGDLKRRPDGATYYDGEQIISHLSYALGPFGWDWTELDRGYDTDADEVWVRGKLTARFVVVGPDGYEQTVSSEKTECGWQPVERKRSDGSIVSLGNNYKAADTDALKRAARLLGVGLDAWTSGRPTTGARRDAAPTSAPRQIDQQPPAEPLSPAARESAASAYVDLLAQATAAGFRASWTAQDYGRWSDAQLTKYSGLLSGYLARTAGAA